MRSRHLPARRAACITTLGALSTFLAPSPVGAQSIGVRVLCTNHGPNIAEPIVDRDGQSLLAAEATCVVQGGPMDGAVETQHNLWHYDKGSGALLSGHAVTRKPGALSATVITQGGLALRMTDGKVSGWNASGTGRMTLATGAAASLAGRSFNWTANPTGPASYVVQVTFGP